MVWKRLQVKKDNSFSGDDGTDVFSIGRAHAIGDMALRVRAKNAADHNVTGTGALAETVVEAISQIKLYSGSRVWKDYDAEICRAFATYKTGRNPLWAYTTALGDTYPAGWQECILPISFSRLPGDPRCMLPAPLLDSLEMSIEFDFDVADGNSENAFLTGTANHKYDLFVDVQEQKYHTTSLEAMSIIVEKKKQDYTTLASGDDKIDLTISPDKQLRQLLTHVYKAGEVEGAVISDIGLKVDQVEYLTDKWRSYQAQNALDCGLGNYEQLVTHTANTATDEIWTRIPDLMPSAHAVTSPTVAPMCSISGDKLTVTTDAGDDLNYLNLQSHVIPATVIFDFDKWKDLNSLLPMGVKDLDLTFTNATASGKLRVYEQTIERL